MTGSVCHDWAGMLMLPVNNVGPRSRRFLFGKALVLPGAMSMKLLSASIPIRFPVRPPTIEPDPMYTFSNEGLYQIDL
jgi:hypothetical protein